MHIEFAAVDEKYIKESVKMAISVVKRKPSEMLSVLHASKRKPNASGYWTPCGWVRRMLRQAGQFLIHGNL